MFSLILFVIQVCLFGAIALYLHYQSEHYGLMPLLLFVAAIMGALNMIELMTLFIEPIPGVVIRPGGHVYVPIILLVVLIFYITNGTRAARLIIMGLVGINLLILCILLFLTLYLVTKDETTVIRGLLAENTVLTPLFLRGVAASVISFTVDMLMIAIMYQGIRNSFASFPAILIPGIALLVALWVDAILYNILAFFGTSLYVPGIPGDVAMKTVAGLLLLPPAGWYLTHVAPHLTAYRGTASRGTLDIIFGDVEAASRMLQLEDELLVSKAIYEQIMQHIEGIFWLADVEKSRLLYLSPNFEQIIGRPREIFIKDPLALVTLLHPEDRAKGMMRKVFLSPETEFRIQREDGTVLWMRNRSFPIITDDQKAVRYAGITEDVTMWRESQLQTFALELSREKVAMLHRFVRDASHDLRTPLTSILLKLDMMERVDGDRQKELQRELRTATQHLNNLIDDMFTLSRIEGDEQFTFLSVDFNDVVRQVCDNHQIIAHSRDIALDVQLIDRHLSTVGNRDQLFRLAANLIANAIHYTQRGTITIRTLVKGHQIVFEVTDTGIGIPPNHLESIFERFHRTDQARTMREDGTGLGLAISKAIVEQHRGTITVESTVGQGTTFRVFLPLNQMHPHPTLV